MDNIIAIDFIAGSHGNYLEFVLNKLVFGDKITQQTPFDKDGASHLKTENYNAHRIFEAEHYSQRNIGLQNIKNVVSIRYSDEDLLPLMYVSLLRAGNYNLNCDELHKNTYQKLSNDDYMLVRDNLYLSYKEFLWEDSQTPKDDCPRFVLREFFKFGFKDFLNTNFYRDLKKLVYDKTKNVYFFDYLDFYDYNRFAAAVEQILKKFNLNFKKYDDIHTLHQMFLVKQPQRFFKQQCDIILDLVCKRQEINITNLTLLQESYINAKLELLFNKEMPFMQNEYFKNTKDIIDYIHGTC